MAEPFELPLPPNELDPKTVKHTGVIMTLPVEIGIVGEPLWLLPTSAIVSVRGRNVITRRNVSKRIKDGTIKELWTTDDYEITLQGMLFDPDVTGYPAHLVSKMAGICKQKKQVNISGNDLFYALGISQMAIESWDFPATINERYQDFQIRGFSDYDYELI